MDQSTERPLERGLPERDSEPTSDTAGLYEKLTAEAERSVRYNHFFSVIVLRCRAEEPEMLLDRVKGQLRGTDHIGLLAGNEPEPSAPSQGKRPQPDQTSGCTIAVALPETDAAGAEPVAHRLRDYLPDTAELRIGVAVFPGDGSDPERLLRRAAARAA